MKSGLVTGLYLTKVLALITVFVIKKKIIIQVQVATGVKALFQMDRSKDIANGIIKRSKNILQVVVFSMKGGAYMIVIKCNLYTDEEGRKNLQKMLLKEANEGVVLLPAYCDLVGVSEDNEIEVDYEDIEDIEY